MKVTPDHGPVGTRVVLEGGPCSNPGAKAAYLVFGNEGYTSPGWGTIGARDIPNVPVDGNGRFRLAFTIPSRLDPVQSGEGGPVVAGRYLFFSKPPYCQVPFAVAPR